MDDSDPLATTAPPPTAARPLLGLTVLVVEDSRLASEAMRLLCLRSGARIRRADTLRAARRHLQIYRPAVVIVDLGLPDGSGAELITELAQAAPRIDVILATSGEESAADLAEASGADGFLAKPVTSLATFQSEVLSRLPPDRQPAGPRILQEEDIRPDTIAFHDDMAHAESLLSMLARPDEGPEAAPRHIDYIAQFVGGVASCAGDNDLARAANDLTQARARGKATAAIAARMTELVRTRLKRRQVI
ncbi:MAG: response regulator [Rhodobacteraceae bacterium]|nr:response regulator [Paracoccaceae bacterium]